MKRTDKLMRYFNYQHLPENLQAVSKKFYDTAKFINQELPDNDEAMEALRKLLEAKDCAVRSRL